MRAVAWSCTPWAPLSRAPAISRWPCRRTRPAPSCLQCAQTPSSSLTTMSPSFRCVSRHARACVRACVPRAPRSPRPPLTAPRHCGAHRRDCRLSRSAGASLPCISPSRPRPTMCDAPRRRRGAAVHPREPPHEAAAPQLRHSDRTVYSAQPSTTARVFLSYHHAAESNNGISYIEYQKCVLIFLLMIRKTLTTLACQFQGIVRFPNFQIAILFYRVNFELHSHQN
eukprot:IDg1362t1